MIDFEGKIVLITGGTKGIGKTLVLEFLKLGAFVYTCFSKDEISKDRLLGEVSTLGKSSNLKVIKANVCNLEACQNLINTIIQDFGKLDILVNNAGIHKDGLFLEMEVEQFQNVFETNLASTIFLSTLAKDALSKGDKIIINMTSISGVYGKIGQANYSSSKGAIIGLTKLLSKKFPGFRVNAVAPGIIETDMKESISDERFGEIINACNIKRGGSTKEVADMTLFLCSNLASYASGNVFFVDGGFLR